MALDTTLEKFAALDPEEAQLADLRCFGDLSVEETAEVMRMGAATIKRR